MKIAVAGPNMDNHFVHLPQRLFWSKSRLYASHIRLCCEQISAYCGLNFSIISFSHHLVIHRGKDHCTWGCKTAPQGDDLNPVFNYGNCVDGLQGPSLSSPNTATSMGPNKSSWASSDQSTQFQNWFYLLNVCPEDLGLAFMFHSLSEGGYFWDDGPEAQHDGEPS